MSTILRETITVPVGMDEAFSFTADFSNIADWDPGVDRSVQADDAPIGPGTRFDLDVRFGGTVLPMQYVITEYEEPTKVVLVGQGERLFVTDTITFAPHDDGTEITYEAEMEFRGWMRFVAPACHQAK